MILGMKKNIIILILIYYWQLNVFAQFTEKWDITKIDTGKFIPIAYSAYSKLNIKCIDALDNNNFVYSFNDSEKIDENDCLKITHNSGKNWDDLMSSRIIINDTLIQVFNILDINYLSSNTIYFIASGSITKINNKPDTTQSMIIFTNDLGQNWSVVKFDSLLNYTNISIRYIKMLNNQQGFALFQIYQKETKKIGYVLLKTINNWKNYQIVYYNTDNAITSIDILRNDDFNKTKILISDERNVILSSINCGKEFKSYFIKNNANYESIEQVKFLSDSSYLVLTYQYKVNVDLKHRRLDDIERNCIYKNTGYTDDYNLFYKSLASKEIIRKIFALNEKNITVDKRTYKRGYVESTTDGGLTWLPNYFSYETFFSDNFDFKYINEKIKIAITSICEDYYEIKKVCNLIIYKSNSYIYTLTPPNIKVNDSLVLNNFNTNGKYIQIDTTKLTLSWDKIQNAEKYHLSIKSFERFGTEENNIDSLPPCFRCDSLILLDTTISDTCIAVNKIKRNMKYIIKITSLNETLNLESVPDYVRLFSPIPLLKAPNIYYPYQSPIVTLTDYKIKFKWESISEAQGYAIIITQYGLFGYEKAIKTYSFYPDTILDFNGLQENKVYKFYVATMNENEISYFNNALFSTGQFTSVEKSINDIIYTICPNPAYSTTRVKLQQEGQVAITAVDLLGRSFPIWSGYAGTGDMELDVSTLPTGSYTLLIDYGTKREAVRLMKE